MTLPGLPAPPSALCPRGECLSFLGLGEPPDPSDPGAGLEMGVEKERPFRGRPEGLVPVLRGALLPFGAGPGFELLRKLGATGHRNDLRFCTHSRLPGSCKSVRADGSASFGWTVASKNVGSPGHSSGGGQAQVTRGSQLHPWPPRPQVGTPVPLRSGEAGARAGPRLPWVASMEACRRGCCPGAMGWEWFAQELPPLRATS